MSADVEDFKGEFNSLCHEVGGTPKFREIRINEGIGFEFHCDSAEEFPDPRRFIELMKKASDLSEKFRARGCLTRFSFSIGKHTSFATYISGEVRSNDERRHIIVFEKDFPYRYFGSVSSVKNKLNAFMSRELKGEEGCIYSCSQNVERLKPPYITTLSCGLNYKEPDFDKMLKIVEKFKDVAEREPKLLGGAGEGLL